MGTSAGRDWLVTSDGEVLCWDIKTGDFMRLDTQLVGKIMQKDRVIIAPAKNSDFWLMWDSGIAYYDFLQAKWSIPEDARINLQDIYTCISTNEQGNAWVGTLRLEYAYTEDTQGKRLSSNGSLSPSGKKNPLLKWHTYSFTAPADSEAVHLT